LYGNGIVVKKDIGKALESFEVAFKLGYSTALEYISREGDPSELFKKSLEHFETLKLMSHAAIGAGIDFKPYNA
jgi:hypothetical protein